VVPRVLGRDDDMSHVISLRVSDEQFEVWKSLPEEKRDLLRNVIRTILSHPTMLDENLQRWIAVKSVLKWVCPVCYTTFSSRKALIEHVRYYEFGDGKCPFCARKSGNILDHLRKSHFISF
jgi:rubrerythrin